MEVAWLTSKTSSTSAKPSNKSLYNDFFADCELQGLTKESIDSYRSMLKYFDIFLTKVGVTPFQVDREVLRGFLVELQDRRFKYKTIANYFTSLSSFYEYLLYEGYVSVNPILPVRKRYLKQYKFDRGRSIRKLISVEDMTKLINSISNPRDKTVVTLLAKTGIRRSELLSLDIRDIDWEEQSITLKPHKKRSNRVVFFDSETARILRHWMYIQEKIHPGAKALFMGGRGRLNRSGVYNAVVKWAIRIGLHDPDSDEVEDHFTPHCCRHWFTTHLRRSGMSRELIKELRGDRRGEAMDIYDHIDRDELKQAYLAYMPKLGI